MKQESKRAIEKQIDRGDNNTQNNGNGKVKIYKTEKTEQKETKKNIEVMKLLPIKEEQNK